MRCAYMTQFLCLQVSTLQFAVTVEAGINRLSRGFAAVPGSAHHARLVHDEWKPLPNDVQLRWDPSRPEFVVAYTVFNPKAKPDNQSRPRFLATPVYGFCKKETAPPAAQKSVVHMQDKTFHTLRWGTRPGFCTPMGEVFMCHKIYKNPTTEQHLRTFLLDESMLKGKAKKTAARELRSNAGEQASDPCHCFGFWLFG